MAYDKERALVHRWLDGTDAIALEHFKIGQLTELKADGTPVTIADRAIERTLRAHIEDAFPADAIVGEEEGGDDRPAERRWIIDPIDGTKNYARGVPVFATLVALEEAGQLVMGFVSAPGLGSRWWGAQGEGAFRDGNAIAVSRVAALDDAHVCTGGIDWTLRTGHSERLLALSSRVARVRGFGDFWGHMLVAQGSLEAMIEFAPLSIWDVAAPKAIVEIAGGRTTTLDGSAALRSGAHVTTNGAIHDDLLRALAL